MNKELAKSISNASLVLKQNLATALKKEFKSLEFSCSLEEMKVIDVATVCPGMEEWLLSRLFNLFGDKKLMDESINNLKGIKCFDGVLSLAAEVLYDIYKHIEEMSGYPKRQAAYRKKLHKKSFLGGEGFGFIVNCEHKMVCLEMFIEEHGSLPVGELFVIDEARNIFSVQFVKKLSDVLTLDVCYYFNRPENKSGYKCCESKLVF